VPLPRWPDLIVTASSIHGADRDATYYMLFAIESAVAGTFLALAVAGLLAFPSTFSPAVPGHAADAAFRIRTHDLIAAPY
jgi:hypothetical protein